MTPTDRTALPLTRRVLLAAGLGALLTAGCAGLIPATVPSPPSFYALDYARPPGPSVAPPAGAPALLVSAPRASAGFDSQHMVYTRQPHKLERFAHSEWIDTPARMLSPLVVAALAGSGAFRAVVPAPSSAGGELRLDIEVLRLQQEFGTQTSRVRFALRADLVEDSLRRVIASQVFEAVVAAPEGSPYGGVTAANEAVSTVLGELASFCALGARGWKPAAKSP